MQEDTAEPIRRKREINGFHGKGGIMDKERLIRRVEEWKEKVINTEGQADTYRMVKEIDQILAEEFDHEPVLG